MRVQLREGARPRAPGKRARPTDVFLLLGRITRAAPRTVPRPRDGDTIPPMPMRRRRESLPTSTREIVFAGQIQVVA